MCRSDLYYVVSHRQQLAAEGKGDMPSRMTDQLEQIWDIESPPGESAPPTAVTHCFTCHSQTETPNCSWALPCGTLSHTPTATVFLKRCIKAPDSTQSPLQLQACDLAILTELTKQMQTTRALCPCADRYPAFTMCCMR